MSKYLIHEEGVITVVCNFRVYDIKNGRHKLIARRINAVGSSYQSDVKANFEKGLNDAIMNIYYKIFNEYEIGSDHYVEYDLKDWDVEYRYNNFRRERYTFKQETRQVRVHGTVKNEKIIIIRRDGKVYDKQKPTYYKESTVVDKSKTFQNDRSREDKIMRK